MIPLRRKIILIEREKAKFAGLSHLGGGFSSFVYEIIFYGSAPGRRSISLDAWAISSQRFGSWLHCFSTLVAH